MNPFQAGELTETEELAAHHLKKLIAECKRGIFSEDKFDLLLVNPAEFLEEYLRSVNVPEELEGEVRAIIMKTIITGFFRGLRRAGMANLAEGN